MHEHPGHGVPEAEAAVIARAIRCDKMKRMCLRRRTGLQYLAMAAALTAASCGESPVAPTPPPAQLTLTCPSAQTAVSTTGEPVVVTWQGPTAQGGTPTIQTTCTHASGSTFAVGTTSVGCSAVSAAASQTATCAFSVTVTRPPQLAVTRFMAFGDSITFGIKSDAAFLFTFFPQQPDPWAYPSQLQATLSTRYPGQALTVPNEGWPGEMINVGLSRTPGALAESAPDVVLLLHGANDLLNSPSSATTQYIAGKLAEIIRTCKARIASNRILLANYPPQFIGTPPNRGAGWALVPDLNGRIASVAASEGVTLVDLYTPMNADVKRYIGVDGLHPTEQGFTLMAQTFAKVIQDKFEVKPTAR